MSLVENLNPIKSFASAIGGLVDKFVQTPDEKAAFHMALLKLADEAENRSQEAMASAREAYKAEWQYAAHTSRFDKFVDGMNRLVRPLVTYGLIAAVFGLVEIPKDINPNIWTPLTVVLAFWFGGRLIKRDGGLELLKGLKKP